jgi:quercetin dioxygenase-like cupin family protein
MKENLFTASPGGDKTRYYMSGVWTFLATGKETNGAFALIDCKIRKSLEPPGHMHLNEDESFYLTEGEVEFIANNQTHLLKAGDFIHLPKNVPHQFIIKSETARFLMHLAPAGLEEFFWQLSRPADSMDMPPMPAGPPPAEIIEKIKALQKQYGIVGMDHSQIKTLS